MGSSDGELIPEKASICSNQRDDRNDTGSSNEIRVPFRTRSKSQRKREDGQESAHFQDLVDDDWNDALRGAILTGFNGKTEPDVAGRTSVPLADITTPDVQDENN